MLSEEAKEMLSMLVNGMREGAPIVWKPIMSECPASLRTNILANEPEALQYVAGLMGLA